MQKPSPLATPETPHFPLREIQPEPPERRLLIQPKWRPFSWQRPSPPGAALCPEYPHWNLPAAETDYA